MPHVGRMTDSDVGGRVRVEELNLSQPPPPPHTVLISYPQNSQLTVSVGGGGGGGWVRGLGYHAPTPRAGRVTDSDEGRRVRVGRGG